MVKDIRRKTRGSWWQGWVKYTYTGLDGSEQEAKRLTDWEYATVGLAQRAAERLAGALAAPQPQPKWRGQAIGPKTKKRPSALTIVEIGVSRVE